MTDNEYFDWEVDKVDNRADLIRLILAILSGIKLLTAALGYHMFNDDVMIAIGNIVPLIIILWATVKQNYITRQDKAKKLALAKEGLIEETPEELIKK
jgi:energy-converting hydrogenase Eha subunit H